MGTDCFGHNASFMKLYGVVSVLALLFWFFLAFPFANHNESYAWIVQFNRESLPEILRGGVQPVLNYRPLGLATAWLGYHILPHGSIYPQQLFNCLVAVLAWLTMFYGIKEKILFSWVCVAVQGAFFSSYVHLFHLHGVFYSPLLFFTAILFLAAAAHGEGLNARRLGGVSILAFVVAFYHPFALLLYIAYVLGYCLENLRKATGRQIAASGCLAAAAVVLLKILVPHTGGFLSANLVSGLLSSYRMVEVNHGVTIMAYALGGVTILGMNASRQRKVILCGIAAALSFVFLWLKAPVLIIWIALCLLKAILMKRWGLAFLVASSAAIPAITGTGSPGYTVFVLLVCSGVTVLGSPFIERDSRVRRGAASAVLSAAIIIFVLLRMDVHIPVVSKLVNPILAEKEKTFQMERIIDWWKTSGYKRSRIVLYQSAENPRASTNALVRTYRPPTQQKPLDSYTSSLQEGVSGEVKDQLLVCFGGEKIDNARSVYVVKGRHNGDAIVWKR